MNLTQAIKERAHHLGFALVGVTTPEPLPHAGVYEEWLQQGQQGEMAYLSNPRSRHLRAHPQEILPECRSILALGVRYPAPPHLNLSEVDPLRSHGIIAAYAWGDDYHTVLPERLRCLVTFIASQVGHPIANCWYTDTGPLLERELAQRAGLGWIGKNTCLINPGQGSYFILAEILLGIELEPDQPFTSDRCGTCQRCLTACPTGCILPDRTLDARRCISYLTIELKGPIPPELRPLIGAHVFGCDICQQVCPWNRFANDEADLAFKARLDRTDVDLLEEIALTTAAFNARYRRSPLKRAKRRGYLRNVATALGSLRHRQAAGILARVLVQDDEPLVRMHAAWALGQISSKQAYQALRSAFQTENDPLVRLEIQNALASG